MSLTWEDGSPRSQGNAFDVLSGYKEGMYARDQLKADIQRRASKNVEKQRKSGKDLSVGALRGKRHGGAFTRA